MSVRTLTALAAVAVVVAGCLPAPRPAPARPRPVPTPDAPPPPAPPSFMPDTEPGRIWETRSHFRQLRFQNLSFAVQPPRDPKLWFFGEREGRLLAAPAKVDAAPADVVTVLDLRDRTLGWQDCGLLNMAFHPDFGKPGSPNG